MGDQRISRERQRFIENEQSQQIAGKSDADGAGDGDREANIEPGLMQFFITAHVADGIERIQRP